MPPDPGRSESKKARTRRAIHEAALRLFLTQGYVETTIAEIAAAADVAPRTFFTHFDSKEALLFEHFEPVFRRFEQVMRERPNGGTALEETRRWLGEDLLGLPPLDPQVDALLDRLGAQVPAVAARELAIVGRLEQHLAAALAVDLGSADDDPTPYMVAAAAVAALYRSALQAGGSDWNTVEGEDTLRQFDRALRFVQHGLDGLARDAAHATGASGPS